MIRRSLGSLVAAVLAACGGGDDAPLCDADADAGAGADAAALELDAAADELPTTCAAACAALTLTATFGAETRGFERGFFGLSAPASSASGEWELHVEASAGGDDGCPTEASATPSRTIVIAGLRLPASAVTVDDAAVNLLDFEGALLPGSPVAPASAAAVTWVAARPCLACSEGDEVDPGRFVAFDLAAQFAGGSAAGRIFATHCGSFDEL